MTAAQKMINLIYHDEWEGNIIYIEVIMLITEDYKNEETYRTRGSVYIISKICTYLVLSFNIGTFPDQELRHLVMSASTCENKTCHTRLISIK